MPHSLMMLDKIRTLASLYLELGPRWSIFRLAYAFRLRTGLICLQMPQYKWIDRPLERWLKEQQSSAGRVGARSSRPIPIPTEFPPNLPWNQQTAIEEADRILNGEIRYFAHQFHQVGFPPNWHEAPSPLPTPSSAAMDSSKHWSQISDDNVIARMAFALPDEAIPNYEETASQRHYDIKFIWEPNRFSFVYTLVRAYAATRNEKYAKAFWQSVLDWAEHNPPNTGPNWMDGQEMSLRLMAWTFGYFQFSNSPSSTPQRIAQFTQFIAAQAERIYKNIDYAISTRSNHTISEAFGLWLVGLLFPELKDSEKYLSLGRKLLEQEAAAQIFPDGSYSMYSLNYHRFVLHIFLYAMRLGELNKSPFSNSLYSSVSASIDYLSQLIDPQTGQMPVYGSNDGALVLPLNNCDFTDYRPLLQLGSVITRGQRIFEPGPWDEDIFWLCGGHALTLALSRKERGWLPSPTGRRAGDEGEGGTYILHNTNSKAILRCTDFRARPSHADQLHMDLWIHGQNIACDAGTFLYSGEGIWRNGLAHTSAHNTVTVDHKDQMTMLSRFTWTSWAKGKVLKHDKHRWQGEHYGYRPVTHKRNVMTLDGDRWLVVDNLISNESHHYALHWLLGDSGVQELATAHGLLLGSTKTDSTHRASELSDSRVLIQMGLVEGNGKFSIVRADPTSTRGWRSRYYGHKEPAISIWLETDQPHVTFWTFFGFESDVVELDGKSLRVNSKKIPLVE
ncbi:MAG: heparinase II/III family protein [Chloroflexota bacterium]|nr:heparinase II/III family protein [Chloroflexota bacterium]